MARVVPCPTCGQLNRIAEGRNALDANCAACKAKLFTGRPIALTRNTFSQQIRSNDLPVLVDFWASWCGPCKVMAPVFEATSGECEPNLRLAKVDTEYEQDLARIHHIQAIPTLILFKGGKEIARRSGAIGAAELRQWIRQVGP